MFKEKIQPSLVLTLICLITCALLVIAHDATYKDNTGVITDDMLASLEEIYGTSNGFTMKLDENERSTQIRLMKVKDMMVEKVIEEKHQAEYGY